MKKFSLWIVFSLFCLIIQGQRIRLVNMMPNAQSNETNQDSEPHLSVNPAKPYQIIGTAFTPNPLGATTPASAPLYFSLDGGLTWTLNAIIPSGSTLTGTGDITIRFGTTTNWLYAGILRSPAASGASRTMDILRTNNFTGTTLMQQILTRNLPDQPYIQAASVLGGVDRGRDRIYVGNNDAGAPNSNTSTMDLSLDATATTPAFSTARLDQRSPANNDAPPVRTAIHPEGVIYSAFFSQTSLNTTTNVVTGNIVVVRDDNWGSGTAPFTDLTDPGDGTPGVRVATGITCPFSGNLLGNERIWQRMNIAVNPNNSNQVYVVYSDFPTGAAPYTLHVRRSDNAGATWTADIRTIANATVPSLAVNSLGVVSFSYQQLTGGNWLTIVETTTDNFVTVNSNTLNSFPDGTPTRAFQPYLGDYAYMTAMPSGKDFVGIFSASNDPTAARFPTVQPTWLRNVDLTTNRLRNLANTANVAVSIDPYFYRVSPVILENDYYVRDWTSSTSSKDLGEEPSTNEVFYLTSDVWNRRSNTAGTFNSNDQPENQDPRPVTAGNNFAFARVHKLAAGNAGNVNMLFLKSEFGTGSNYQLINGVSSFTSLSFSATDVQQTMTTGVQWDLIDPAAITANHVCMAVEIAGPNDPSGNPTLLGRAPGWSNGTDLLVISDNNKAQRNLNVFTGSESAGEAMSMYAVAHNAALFERNMRIDLRHFGKEFQRSKYRLSVIGARESGRTIAGADSLLLMNMKPGENRWIEISVSTMPPLNAEPVTYIFEEKVDEMKVNGFGVGVQIRKLDEAGLANLGEHAFVFNRLCRQFNYCDGPDQAKDALQLLDGPNEAAYISFLQNNGVKSVQLLKAFVNSQGFDPFNVVGAGNNFASKIQNSNWNGAAMAHGNFMRKANAYLSMLDKSGGDVADIIQTVRWLKDIVRRSETFKQSSLAKISIQQSDDFINLYSERQLFNKDFPTYIKDNLSLWKEMVQQTLPAVNFDPRFTNLSQNLNDPKKLQKSLWEFVYELNSRVSY